MPDRFDVIVVGGGTAGCVLAARLSEDPERTVCLVEAGPDYGHFADGRWPADMLDARTLPMSHLWETEAADRSASRARILGGCSAHNACLVVWGSREDYDEWGDGWTFAEFEQYLRGAEASIRTRTDRTDDLSPFHRALLDAGPRVGLPQLEELNDLDATVGIAPAPVNAVGTVRWNAAFAYLDDARSRSNLTIVPETLVDRVEIAAGRAVGVVSDSGRLTAETVVVAAGAYGSPALLLRSGIGPYAQLRRLGVAVIEELPVGVGLADHPGVGIEWSPVTDHVPLDEGPVFATSLLVRARSDSCPQGTWDLHVLPWLEASDEGWRTTAVVYLLKPDSRGSVTLRSTDPRVPPAVDHGFLAEPHDLDRLASGVGTIRALAEEAGCGPELRPGDHDPLGAYLRREVRGIFHPTGTCAIGAVVDARGAVLGVDGLLVADASIMPTIPRANTNLSTIAVAERIADWLRD
jgi:choline dehydrogenase-like flavoprotein